MQPDVTAVRHVPGQHVLRQPVGSCFGNVAPGPVARNLENVRASVVGEHDLLTCGADGERDVGPVLDAAGTIVLRPALVMRHLGFVIAGRNRPCRKGIEPVAVRVLQPRAQAIRLPVARATELGLEAAGHRGDDGILIARDPVRRIVIEELDVGCTTEAQRDVAAVACCIGTVILEPVPIDDSLVFPIAGRDIEDALPDAVRRIEVQERRAASRIPVAATTELALETARYRHRRRNQVVADHVRTMVVRERDTGGGRDAKREVGPTTCTAGAVVLIPGVVQCHLVLIVAGRHDKRRRPHDAVGSGQFRTGALRLPVTGAR